MEKILLYYRFAPLADPEAVRLWQRALCERLGLRGRILISQHGINGTLGGEIDNLKTYVKETKQYPAFKDIDFKWSEGGAAAFPKLSVKVRGEIVTFGAADEIEVDVGGIVGGGQHLTPAEVHSLIESRDDVVFFDGRNSYEAAIGRFKGAVVPAARTSKDFKAELDSGAYDHLKEKPVVTYCTGGVRCEVLSRLMKNRGFNEVYQLDGGIVRYGEAYGDDGLWEGSLYVFDDRMTVNFSDESRPIGRCIHCGGPTSRYTNCAVKTCNDLVLICEECAAVRQRDRCAACQPSFV